MVKSRSGFPSKTVIAFLLLIVCAALCYSFIVWSNCDSSVGTFVSDFVSFHTSEC